MDNATFEAVLASLKSKTDFLTLLNCKIEALEKLLAKHPNEFSFYQKELYQLLKQSNLPKPNQHPDYSE